MSTESSIAEKLVEIVGGDRVSIDAGELLCYSFDSSYVRGQAEYVVRPRTTEDVAGVVELAYDHGIPVVARGAASGLTGGAVPVQGGIVLDMTGMDRIISVEIENMQVYVEAGVIHSDLNSKLARQGYFFPPDPASTNICTIGGMIGNNASGMRSVKYGTTRNYVLDLEVVLPDGRIINTGSKALKTASGFDLTQLFVGSEGLLGIVTRARLKILPLPEARSIVVAYFDDLEDAGRAVVKSLSSGVIPSAIELLDGSCVQAVKKYDPNLKIPDVEAILLFEVDGLTESIGPQCEKIDEACRAAGAVDVAIPSSKKEQEDLWAARKMVGVAVTALVEDYVRVYEADDVVVPISRVPEMLRLMGEIGEANDLPLINYGHIGDGDLHTGMTIDLLNEEHWKRIERVKDAIYQATIEMEGNLTGEHGTGYIRGPYMEMEHGARFEVMRAIKRAIDPKGIMNPGKMGM